MLKGLITKGIPRSRLLSNASFVSTSTNKERASAAKDILAVLAEAEKNRAFSSARPIDERPRIKSDLPPSPPDPSLPKPAHHGTVRAISNEPSQGKKSDAQSHPHAQTGDKLASMQRYIDAGRKITPRQYEEVLASARENLEHWLELIHKGIQGGHFDVRSSTTFLRVVKDKKSLACAVGLAAIVLKKPDCMDAKFYQTLVGALLKLDAPHELVQQIIASRPDLDAGEYKRVLENLINLPPEVRQMYLMSNENNKEKVAELYKALRESRPDYTPDLVTFTRIAHALGPPVNDWPLTWALTQSVMKSDAPRDVLFYNVVLRALTYCDEPDDADLRIAQDVMRMLREDNLKPDKDTYLALMDVYFRNGRGKQAIDLLQMMTSDGVECDKVMLSRFVKELVAINEPDMALDVLSQNKIPGTRQLYAYIEEAFVNDGNLDKAAQIRLMYREAKTSELGGELEKAVRRSREEEAKHTSHEGREYLTQLENDISRHDTDTSMSASACNEPRLSTAETYAEILRTETRFGRFSDVRATFARMVDNISEEIDPFTSALYAFAVGVTQPKQAIPILRKYEKRIKPHHIVVHAALRGILASDEFASASDSTNGKSPASQPTHQKSPDERSPTRERLDSAQQVEIVESVEEYVDQHKIKLSKSSLDLLIDFYCDKNELKVRNYLMPKLQKANVMDDRAGLSYVKSCAKQGPISARQAISTITKIPSLAVHNVMLETYMTAGQCDEAVKYFGEMQSLFATPNSETYEILVLGFLRNDRASSALSIFGDLMHKASTFRPTPKMVYALVQHLIKQGDGNEMTGDLIFRLVRDVRGRHVTLTKQTYDEIISFVKSQPDYPPSDLEWILGHAKGDEILINDAMQRAVHV
eukprot:Phypoly_transcript_02081.p1 GENE.Phypoly_transcript_02081~~Phypoly_transcript_02081.p1  ORF type:complete len:873 (+),score=188.30 Phypoly_transcript_02081:291-2909(+)